MISVIVADDHAVVRAGVRKLLEAETDLAVVAEAADGVEAFEHVAAVQPDVLVLDVVMPRLNGFDLARQLARGESRTRVVFLSMHSSEAYVIEALRAGASAYVLKEAAGTEIVAAVRAAASGGYYVSAGVSVVRLEAYVEKAEPSPASSRLTPRERQVLQLAAEGRSNAEIASLLGVSRRTIETHRANLRSKLDIHDARDLVRFALRSGLIRID